MSQNSMRYHKKIKAVIPLLIVCNLLICAVLGGSDSASAADKTSGDYIYKVKKNTVTIVKLLIICILLISAVIWGSDSALAADKTSGDYTYKVKKNTVTIVKYVGKKKKVEIPSKIKGMKVVNIGKKSFAYNKKISKVTIPDNVKSIQKEAFSNCTSLKEVGLPDIINKMGNEVFDNCTKLSKVKMPSSMKELPKYMFSGCENLSSITLPNDLIEIGPGALCLTSIKTIIFPISLKKIDEYAFWKCTKLEVIVLPEGLSVVADETFQECTQLKSVYLPDSITSIGKKAFEGCVNLASIDLPDELTTLKEDAFIKCSKLVSVTLPSKLVLITDDIGYFPIIQDLDFESEYWEYDIIPNSTCYHPFAECTSLKELIISADNSRYTTENGILYDKNKTAIICYPPAKEGQYQIPESVKVIMPNSFQNVAGLKELSIPNTVTNIGAYAFYKAMSLKNITLPDNLTQLQPGTFVESGIEFMKLPDSLVHMHEFEFNNCASLKTLEIPAGLDPMQLDNEFEGPFNGCTSLESITVADGNKYYKDIDGVLFEIEKGSKWSSLLCYPAKKKGKTYKVAKYTTLYSQSFDHCKYLRKVIIPEGIVSLFNPFRNCKNLKVLAPRSVKHFPTSEHYLDFPVFTDCKNCVLLVHKNSMMHKQCIKQEIPYKVMK